MAENTPYRATIGLEIHAELKTRTKMFCNSANNPDEEHSNVNVCPVCLAHPGTLPVINRQAVEHVLRVGAAIGGSIADYTEFDRKSYFYPDIPKGYQISQYKQPLVSGGELLGVAITRVHLEEDTARSSHEAGKSLVDFNRAGVPLMELVTEPVIHDAKTAGAFARELQLLLRTIGASDANLEKGEMRIEANISVSRDSGYGTKVEVKNINSFRSVERAIVYEIERQSSLLDSGGSVVQETRGWDETKQETFHQRFKEGSADYRYFPEPDLPKLSLSDIPEFQIETLRASLPELPWVKRARYEKIGIPAQDASYLTDSTERAAFFDEVVAEFKDSSLVKLAANYIISDIAGIQAKANKGEFGELTPESFKELIKMIGSNELSSRGGKDLLAVLVENGGPAAQTAREKGLLQVSDPQMLKEAIKAVIEAETEAVKEFKAGKEAALQYLVGKAMKATKGAGNPTLLREMLRKELA